MPNSPDFTFNVTTAYDWPMFQGTINGFVSGSYFYRSEAISALDQDPNALLEGYGLVDASVGLRAADDKWQVSLFAKNVLEEKFVETIIDTPFDGGGYSQFLSPASESIEGIRLDLRN